MGVYGKGKINKHRSVAEHYEFAKRAATTKRVDETRLSREVCKGVL